MNLGIDGLTFIELIGRGGFGAVYRVRDEVHGRDLAVKILPAPLDDSARRQFDRERRAMGVLSGHPNIGVVHTSGFTSNDEPYIAMELLRGGSLANRLEHGPLTIEEVLQIGAAVADALAVAHDTGVLHLDVKPENILFSDFGSPKLVDFGIAALADDERYTSTIRATPAYAAPEILDGQPATASADVYGLAVTIYALLMGTAPYAGDSMLTVLRRIAVEPVPEVYRPDTPPALVELLRRAMGKTPADRPASMREFADALRAVDPHDRGPHAVAPPDVLPPPPAAPTSAQALPPEPVLAGPADGSAGGHTGGGPIAPPPGQQPSGNDGGSRRAMLVGGVVVALAVIAGVLVFTRLGGDAEGTRVVTTRTTAEGRSPIVTTPRTDRQETTPPTEPATTLAATTTTELPATTTTTDVPPTTVRNGTGIGISDVQWTLDLDDDFLPTDVAVVVPDGSPQFCLTWMYEGVAVDSEWTITWDFDQEPQPGLDGEGEIFAASDLFYACVTNDEGVVPGTYEITWRIDGDPLLIDAIYVGGGREPVLLELVNASESDLCEAYVSPSAAQSWGVNSLFGDVVAPDESRTIAVASGGYDIRIVDCAGRDVLVEVDGPELVTDQQLVVTEP